MWLTAYSKNLVLIEITKVSKEAPVVKDGIEIRKFSFSGKVIETIRGEGPKKEYSYTGFTLRFVDMEAAKKAVGDVRQMEALFYRSKSLCGAENCEVGERYLAVQSKLGEHFALISKNDKTWREQIRKQVDGL